MWISCKADFGKDTLFSEFRIESNSNNEIWLEIHLEALLRVLRSCETSGQSASGCEMRHHPWYKLTVQSRQPSARQGKESSSAVKSRSS